MSCMSRDICIRCMLESPLERRPEMPYHWSKDQEYWWTVMGTLWCPWNGELFVNYTSFRTRRVCIREGPPEDCRYYLEQLMAMQPVSWWVRFWEWLAGRKPAKVRAPFVVYESGKPATGRKDRE